MSLRLLQRLREYKRLAAAAVGVTLLAGIAAAIGINEPARKRVRAWLDRTISPSASTARRDVTDSHGGQDEAAHDHGDDHGHGHNHDHDGHDEANSLHLSRQARRNIGLTDQMLQPIRLGMFTRMLDVPARVVEKPGRTRIEIPAPMTGMVTAVYCVQGEAVTPGTLLFRIRLTHEDLVQAQTDFLTVLGELDVEEREIVRLTGLDERGVIAGKTLLERQYARQKLQALLSARREALLLHGLSTEQIEQIAKTRHLLRELDVVAPALHTQLPPGALRGEVAMREPGEAEMRPFSGLLASPRPAVSVSTFDPAAVDVDESALEHFTIQRINVHSGQFVQAGQPLCVLTDLRELYVEGRAFEHDSDQITRAARNGWKVTAIPEDHKTDAASAPELEIAYVNNEVERDSRALYFYALLPNQIVHETTDDEGRRFLTWRFKPGQRMQLRVPVEQWKKRIVLPVEAVAREGAERYVFRQNGDHFDRVSVHVEYEDQFSVVIANDGALFPGDVVAFTGAHQMQMALKNKAGGGVDPHAGHNH